MKKFNSLADFVQDDVNANRGTERGDQMIEKSLSTYGFGRPILADRNGKIIAGNKTQENALQLGMVDNPIIVESDGTRPIIHVRTDLDMDTDGRARELAIADNRTAQVNLNWDADALMQLQNDGADLSSLFTDQELNVMFSAAGQTPVATEESTEVAGHSRGLGTPIVRFEIVFDDEMQQAKWFEFMKAVKGAYPAETFADSLTQFCTAFLEGR